MLWILLAVVLGVVPASSAAPSRERAQERTQEESKVTVKPLMKLGTCSFSLQCETYMDTVDCTGVRECE